MGHRRQRSPWPVVSGVILHHAQNERRLNTFHLRSEYVGLFQGAGYDISKYTTCLIWRAYTYSAPGMFYVNDGAKISDGTGAGGVRVIAEGLAPPTYGSTVMVTGVVSCYRSGGDTFACLRVRRQSDIVP